MLYGHGEVWQEFPLLPSPTRRADVVFVPGVSTPSAVPLGAMARLAVTPSIVEAFAGSVGLEAYERVLSKTLELRRGARRRHATPQHRALRCVRLWLLCGGHPRRLLAEAGARPLPDAPRGFYLLSAVPPAYLVSLRQLPRGDDTLLLRLLAKQLAHGALHTLRARADADPRLMPILQTMVEYVRSLNPDTPGVPSMLDVTTEMKKWEQALLRQGRRKGLKEGLEKGLEKGLSPLQRQFARRLGRPLSAAEQSILVARLDTLGPDRLGDVVLDLSPEALGAWLSAPDAR
jgi:hypothetical protein